VGEDTLTGNKTGRYELPLDDPEFFEQLLKAAEESKLAKVFQAGEWIFHAGEEPEGCWLIGSGRIAQYRGESSAGNCINELGPRRFLGVRAFHLGMPYTTSAQAVEPSSLIWIGGPFYSKLLKSPQFVYLVIQQQEKEICEVSDAVLRARVDTEAFRREINQLREEVIRYEKMSPEQLTQRDVRTSVTERTLRLLAPDIVELKKDAGAFLRELPPEALKAVRNNLAFGRIFAAITRCANRVRSIEFTRR
jgi:CRP-like cAMP-binding protein